jgi:pyridoxine 5-phosphate synthase
MPLLSVNINKVATLRNTRPLDIPSLTHCATLALNAGAHGITIHPRPDHRHIRPPDVDALATLLQSYPRPAGRPAPEFNIEGNPFHDYLPHILRTRPQQCTLVPDDPADPTSNRGWPLAENASRLRPLIAQLKSLGSRVSLFMDPASPEFPLARDLGADRIELYTEPYAAAHAQGGDPRKRALDLYAAAGHRAAAASLGINAGHDLNLANLPDLVAALPNLLEVSIGHALIADALEFGLPQTVQKYLAACQSRSLSTASPIPTF